MLGLGYLAQQPRVVFVACTHAARSFPFLEQHFQVVQHQQHTCFAQVFQQQAQASFQAGRYFPQRLGGEHLQAVLQ